MKLKYYSDGLETKGVKVKLGWIEDEEYYDWDLFIYPDGLLLLHYNSPDFKITGVDEI